MQSNIHFFKRFPFAMLLCVQLLSVLCYGFMADSKTSHVIFNCLGLIVPILAVWVVYRSPATSWIGFTLVTASISTTLLALFGGQVQLLIWGFALVYSVCQQIYPQSTIGGAPLNVSRSWAELLFLSFSIQCWHWFERHITSRFACPRYRHLTDV